MTLPPCSFFFFFFNDTATTEIYTLSLHDALPISSWMVSPCRAYSLYSRRKDSWSSLSFSSEPPRRKTGRSEEHTSELQSRPHLVCRLLLEKKKKKHKDKRESSKRTQGIVRDMTRY